MNFAAESSFGIIVILLATAFLPLLAVTVTAFAKVAIVIFIVRNAIGVQQLPPNIILYGLSLILAAFISTPVIADAFAVVSAQQFSFEEFTDYQEAAELASAPLREFLTRHADGEQVGFFLDSTRSIWGERYSAGVDAESMFVLVPSFLLSELTAAFEIGFLLYLPFMAVDIIVTTILVALGMMMVPPTTIAIPFKLMLFVFLDGWTRIVQGLILSYA